jgi:hypothetical protein
VFFPKQVEGYMHVIIVGGREKDNIASDDSITGWFNSLQEGDRGAAQQYLFRGFSGRQLRRH